MAHTPVKRHGTGKRFLLGFETLGLSELRKSLFQSDGLSRKYQASGSDADKAMVYS